MQILSVQRNMRQEGIYCVISALFFRDLPNTHHTHPLPDFVGEMIGECFETLTPTLTRGGEKSESCRPKIGRRVSVVSVAVKHSPLRMP